MPSVTETRPSEQRSSRGTAAMLEVWNRKLHFYTGLYLLFFLWLFTFTGLLLNHPKWTFADFWPTRRQSTYERAIQPPSPGDDLLRARDIMRQLGIRGEIEWTATAADPNRFDFRVSEPGRVFEIKTDLARGRAAVQRLQYNGWGLIRTLHTFSGVRLGDDRNGRDWPLTTLWAISMDAVAAGLIFMALSSIYMWTRLRNKRTSGAAALAAGILTCGLFVFGLRWLF